MLKFQEESLRQSVNGALALRHQINPFLDAIFEKGITNICFLGIGGTYASAMQTVSHMKEFTSMEVFAENAAEYITTGNRRIMDGTLLIYSSVTGSTPEIVKAIEKAHAAHATILAFLDNPNPHLRELCELCISYPQNEQLKLFMAADRILFLRHEFDCYDDCYENFDCYLADALISVEQSSDSFAQEFAKSTVTILSTILSVLETSGVPPIPMACAIGRRCTGWQLRLYLPVNFSMEHLKSFLATLLSHSLSAKMPAVHCLFE